MESNAKQEPVAWKHDCAALLTNGVELWIGACPHCGKPRPAPQPKPAEQGPIAPAMATVIAAMQADPEYAWSWHCNIAMAFVDAGGDYYTANQGAARFMKLLANVEPAHDLPAAPQPKPAEQGPVRGEWLGYTWNPYAVSQPRAEPLTDEEIYECERIAAIRHHRHKNSIRGQQITPADDPQWHFANAIIAAYERKNGIGEQP